MKGRLKNRNNDYSHSEPIYEFTTEPKRRMRIGTRHLTGTGQQIGEITEYKRKVEV